MINTIKSDTLCISVNSIGAELQSIFSPKTETEYLWQGEPPYWPGRAPILFPIVGRLKNGVYHYDGQTYTMDIHGFMHQAKFNLIRQVDHGKDKDGVYAELVYEYSDTPQMYPFDFDFLASYILRNNTLDIKYCVRNKSKGKMLFGLGSHEGYRCPLHPGESFDDYYLEFDKDASLYSCAVSADGLLTDSNFLALEKGRHLQLTHSLFANDALVFKNIESKKVALKSNKSPISIEVVYDASHLAIWTQPDAPFICIEPWYSLPDYENTDGNFVTKDSILCLSDGEEEVFSHSIRVIE